MTLNMALSLGSQTTALEGRKLVGEQAAKARVVVIAPLRGIVRGSQEEGLRGLTDSWQERSRPEVRPL